MAWCESIDNQDQGIMKKGLRIRLPAIRRARRQGTRGVYVSQTRCWGWGVVRLHVRPRFFARFFFKGHHQQQQHLCSRPPHAMPSGTATARSSSELLAVA